MPLKLTNTHYNLTAFSMTMTLPKGLKILEGESTSRFAGVIEVGSPDPSANIYNVCGIDLASGAPTTDEQREAAFAMLTQRGWMNSYMEPIWHKRRFTLTERGLTALEAM